MHQILLFYFRRPSVRSFVSVKFHLKDGRTDKETCLCPFARLFDGVWDTCAVFQKNNPSVFYDIFLDCKPICKFLSCAVFFTLPYS